MCGTTGFMNVSDGMYLLTTSASVGGASGEALLRLLAPFVISVSSQASPAYARFSTAPVQSMSHVFLASIALLYAAWKWSRPRRYTSRCDVSTTSLGRSLRYGVGVEIQRMSLSDATGTPRARRMSRASRRVGRVDMSEDEDEDEGDGAAGAMPRLLARSSIALAGVVGKDEGGRGCRLFLMNEIKLFSLAESSDLRARRGRVGGVRTRPR